MPPGVGILRYFFCRGTLGWTHVETIPMNWCDRAGVCDPPGEAAAVTSPGHRVSVQQWTQLCFKTCLSPFPRGSNSSPLDHFLWRQTSNTHLRSAINLYYKIPPCRNREQNLHSRWQPGPVGFSLVRTSEDSRAGAVTAIEQLRFPGWKSGEFQQRTHWSLPYYKGRVVQEKVIWK